MICVDFTAQSSKNATAAAVAIQNNNNHQNNNVYITVVTIDYFKIVYNTSSLN